MFGALVNELDWTNVTEAESPDRADNLFSSPITNCTKQNTLYIPITRWFSARRNPWITNGLMRSISKERQNAQETKMSTMLLIRFKKYSNTLGAVLKHAKRD